MQNKVHRALRRYTCYMVVAHTYLYCSNLRLPVKLIRQVSTVYVHEKV